MTLCRGRVIWGLLVVLLFGGVSSADAASVWDKVNAWRDNWMLSSRAKNLNRKADQMSTRLKSCDSSLLSTVRGTEGYQIDGVELSCDWLRFLKSTVEKYARTYPAVERVFSRHAGAQVIFDMTWKKDDTAFAKADGRNSIYGCAIFLSASYLTRPRTGDALSVERWEHYVRCLPEGVDFPAERQFQPATLRRQVDALFESFFAETAAQLAPWAPPTNAVSTAKLPATIPLSDRVSLTYVDVKLGTGLPQPDPISRQPYFPYLVDEIRSYFSDPAALPPEVETFDAIIAQSCIRPGYGRHQPSRDGACLPGQAAYTVVTVSAKDRNQRELLPMAIPITSIKGDDVSTFFWPTAYTDTIPLPFKPGLFRVLMKRIGAELSLALQNPRS